MEGITSWGFDGKDTVERENLMTQEGEWNMGGVTYEQARENEQ